MRNILYFSYILTPVVIKLLEKSDVRKLLDHKNDTILLSNFSKNVKHAKNVTHFRKNAQHNCFWIIVTKV